MESKMHRLFVKFMAALAVIFVVSATPAMAQATRTWVSGVGDDVNPCSRTAPCKTFAGAISKTAATGEINCLDPGGFGGVTITKSITLRCIGVQAGVLVAATNGISINAGVNDRVVLIGLDIEGLGAVGGSLNGVNILQAGSVLIQDCTIHAFTGASGGDGIVINTTQLVKVVVDHSTIGGNIFGIDVISTAGMGHVTVQDSLLYDNQLIGIKVLNAGNDATIRNNTITGSPNSLVIKPGTSVISYGGNLLSSGSVPTTTQPLQ